MFLPISSQNRLMVVVVRDYQRKYQDALAMSAKLGGYRDDMSAMLTRLIMWQRENDMDFAKWFKLTQEAGEMWIQWYDWYTRLDSRLERAS